MNNVSAFLPQGDDVESLSETECKTMLSTRSFGRVGVTSGGLPVILPVRYVYADDVITFRTGAGTKLRAAQNGDVLAFEVDVFDSDTHQGWSVLVLGRAAVLTTESTGDHEASGDGVPTLDPGPVADGRHHFVRLHCELVTGRRLAPPPGWQPAVPGASTDSA